MAADSPDQQLAWEARQRPRAGIAALLGGLLTFASYVGGATLYRDVPRAYFVESLERVSRPGPIGGLPSLQLGSFRFLDQHAAEELLLGVLSLLGAIGLAWALGFLAVATRARRLALRRWAIYLPIVGGVLLGLANVLQPAGRVQLAHDFLSGPQTVDRATGDLNAGILVVASYIGFLAALLVAVAFVLVSLNAMRAGLLTRFMGAVGVISGIIVIVPLGGPVVESFWLVAVGALFLGRWPTGVPPAWRSGREEPWPSATEAAQQRRERAGRATPAEPAPKPARQPAAAGGARRKRKRRD